MTKKIFSESEVALAREFCRQDFYFFVRWMFYHNKGIDWIKNGHHEIMARAMNDVFYKKITRLIINIAPRYGKTEMVIVLFSAWALGKFPDSEFIHASYSGTLAGENAYNTRQIVTHPEYQAIFPDVQLRADSKSKDHWKTTKGGVFYATGTGGTCTGYGAGKERDDFGGCFPYEELVSTDKGYLCIGDIVEKRLSVKVHSFNFKTHKVELQPIDTFWHNPANDIIKIELNDGSVFKCTPNHKIMTSNGWIEAQNLTKDDLLPKVFPDVFDLMQTEIKFFHQFNSSFATIQNSINDCLRMFGFIIPVGINQIFSYGYPSSFGFNRADSQFRNTIYFRKDLTGIFTRKNINNTLSSQFSPRSTLKQWKSTMSDSILHVIRFSTPSKIAKSVISGVAIKMPAFHFMLLNTFKRFQHKMVNVFKGYFGVNRKIDSIIPFPVFTFFKNLFRYKIWRSFAINLSSKGFNSSLIADFVNTFKSEYRFPVFINKIGYVDKTYCLEVRSNNNFFVSQGQVLVSNCILLDDPHKADEARSDAMRNGVLEWYGNTLQSRVNSSNTPIVLIMQRLHEQDLAGWLLDGGSGEKWEHINIPAINADGTALWPHKHTIEKLREMEQANPYNFSGQYLQLPSPPDGGLFKPEQLKIMEVLPIGEKIQWVRGWDLASSTNGDFTVGAKLGRMADGRLVIGDIVRIKVNADERDAIIQNTAAFDGNMCKISLPQDPGQAGKTQILYLTRSLQGYRVVSSMESGNKVIRAEPFAAQVNIGNVYILRGAWNQALINEMRMFPNGKNDDQIDALSRCFEQLLTGGMGFKISSAALERASRFNRRRF